MQTINGKNFDEERALYAINDATVTDCTFDGPADGESAFKEAKGRYGQTLYLQAQISVLAYDERKHQRMQHDRGLPRRIVV